MNKSQLIDALAARFDGNRKAAAHALESVLDTITREVAKGEKVAITGFGSFEKRVREARWVRNPQTGARIKAKKTAVPKFTAGADLKNVVSGAKKLPKLVAREGDRPGRQEGCSGQGRCSGEEGGSGQEGARPRRLPGEEGRGQEGAREEGARPRRRPAKKAAGQEGAGQEGAGEEGAPAKKAAGQEGRRPRRPPAKKAPAKKAAGEEGSGQEGRQEVLTHHLV